MNNNSQNVLTPSTIVIRPQNIIKPVKLDFIDSLRGVAILMVILVHTSQGVEGLSNFSQGIADYGQMGVQLFFVLSAFTLCLSLDKNHDKKEPITFFYLRRFFRIAPMYYSGIVFYYIINYLREKNVGEIYTLENIISNLLFYHGYFQPANNYLVPGGWSIGTEIGFYALFPIIFFVFKKIRKNYLLLTLAPFIFLAASYLINLIITGNGFVKNGSFLYFHLINQLPVFMIGVSFYFLNLDNANRAPGIQKYLYLPGFVLFTFFTIIQFKNGGNFALIPFLSGLTFLLLIKAFQYLPFLNIRILRRVGELSFSMYVIHFVIAGEVTWRFSKKLNEIFSAEITLGACFLATVVLAIIISSLTERIIEKNGILLGKALIKKMQIKSPHQTVTSPAN